MQISTAIKVIMAEKNMSALALAKKTNLNRSSIHRTVNNHFNPRLENLEIIATKGFEMKLSELIARAETYK